MVLHAVWSEDTREGDWLDYNFDVDPYSLQDDSPSTKLQKIGQALERFVFPVLPAIQAQGGSIDFRRLLELVARLGNVDELQELVIFGEPAQPEATRPERASGQPAFTHRTYERVNRPGATRQGKDDVMSRILMGAKAQSSEVAALGRPTT